MGTTSVARWGRRNAAAGGRERHEYSPQQSKPTRRRNESVLETGIEVSYKTYDNFLYTIDNKTTAEKQHQRVKYFTQSSLIIDDMMYTGVREKLVKFYYSIMLLNETRSIIFITNRELSS